MVLGRYRLTLVPVIILFAASALVRLFDALHEKRIGSALTILGLVVGIAALQQLWLPFTRPEEYLRPQEYLLAAQIYASEGRFDRAVSELERLGENAGKHAALTTLASEASLLEGDYRAQWAKRLIEEGRLAEARRQVERASEAYAPHLGLGYPSYNLGLLYLRLNEREKARALFQRFLEIEPDDPRSSQVRRILAGLQDPS
jgi:tetratricopeptide (TPR) repeat protein